MAVLGEELTHAMEPRKSVEKRRDSHRMRLKRVGFEKVVCSSVSRYMYTKRSVTTAALQQYRMKPDEKNAMEVADSSRKEL
ncbi:hypothetical protein P3T76_004418 [Phytophthora citrophthora]|uniref:Uncharacterized protein n=1 Tax=Phytophthora citrophthora TaxID=4793 RepID=A0AAD9GUV7_9STRA|nr:hypothetical protein P3T76_004418 [Phytophthora citrophthora]